jgi:hypothetical protein
VEIGDLLILFFIVSGILSSLVGGKKKKKKNLPQTRQRPTRAGQARNPPASPRPTGPRPSLDPNHPAPVASQMEEILRQLGLHVEPEVEEEAPSEPEPPPNVEVDAVGRVLPRAVSLEAPARPAVAPDTEERHEEFHEDYMRDFRQTRIARPASRAHEMLGPGSLRQAILFHEILGPPKGLR